MQLVALDEDNPLLATEAQKQKNYQCPECKQSIRVRSGPHRKPHYYHLRRSVACRQEGKSAEHLTAQLQLLRLLPENQCRLELCFPSIGRIADVAWETRQIIFEIQCSPISLEEVEARTLDYRSLGMRVVWILHDNRFNVRNLSAAEHYLRNQPCYYTNITQSGTGIFYDQFECVQGSRRLFKGPRLPVALNKPVPREQKQRQFPVASVNQRACQWDLSFEGDLLNRLERAPENSLRSLTAIEKKFTKTTPPHRLRICMALRRLYALLLDRLIRLCSSS